MQAAAETIDEVALAPKHQRFVDHPDRESHADTSADMLLQIHER
ncbi:hypothetical protein MET9862_01965 [Methylobacterium symbioticum]|uniref:Uncharacterized protein n=1 Tax=Methylobacterium symbioticum TaxID=2584084 RepID=A0A509ECZ2_9HYPH|nr:hypothetical protein MET9862_01965 [Methylobacterium symbioticum]